MPRFARLLLAASLLILPAWNRTARAVFLYGNNGDATGRNLSAPTGALAGSGWQSEFAWGVGAATAIAPNYFITAAHLGGSVGQSFQAVENGVTVTYTTTAEFLDPGNSDLAIWKVDKVFTTYAPLYTGSGEAGLAMIDFGRGTQRGSAVLGPKGSQGYQWGSSDGAMSWGQNTVSGSVTFSTTRDDYLTFQFAAVAPGSPTTTSTLSSGDSGGGLFVLDPTDGLWKLAGVNYGVDGNYLDSTGKSIGSAALYDQRGFFYNGDPGIVPTSAPSAQGQFSYSTRISTKLDFINAVVPAVTVVPEPASLGLVTIGLGVGFVWGRRRARRTEI